MATTEITATKNPSDLHDVLGRVEKVFLNKEVNKLPSALTGTFDFKLPILDESVTFNMGEADVTRVKLIDQTNWTSYAKKGDPDISFRFPRSPTISHHSSATRRGRQQPILPLALSSKGIRQLRRKSPARFSMCQMTDSSLSISPMWRFFQLLLWEMVTTLRTSTVSSLPFPTAQAQTITLV